MNIFLPSMFVVLFAGLFVFLVVPRISPFVIFILSIIFLILAIYVHIQMFGEEYANSIWRNVLQKYASFFFIILIVLVIVSYLTNFLPNFRILRIPQFLGHGREKIITNTKTYNSVPIEKLIAIEKQL
jgi:phosphatidylglycerophosphate synthase